MSNNAKKTPTPNPLAQLRAAERNLALAVVESAHTIGVVGTTVMQAVVARHRQATDAALERIAGAAEEVQGMAREVTDAFLKTAAQLRGDVEQNEDPDLPELMGPPPPEQSQTPALNGPVQQAVVPRKPRATRKPAPTEAPALPAPIATPNPEE